MSDDTSARFTRKGLAVREHIVDATAELMFEHGVEGTSLENVRSSAGVSGSQLAHYFADKRDLTRRVIAARRGDVRHFHTQRQLGALDSIEALQAWADACVADVDNVYRRGGCVYGSLAGELLEAVCSADWSSTARSPRTSRTGRRESSPAAPAGCTPCCSGRPSPDGRTTTASKRRSQSWRRPRRGTSSPGRPSGTPACTSMPVLSNVSLRPPLRRTPQFASPCSDRLTQSASVSSTSLKRRRSREPTLERGICGIAGFAPRSPQPRAVEDEEDAADEDEDGLVEGPRDRQQPQHREPAERTRDAPVAGDVLHRSESPDQERPHRAVRRSGAADVALLARVDLDACRRRSRTAAPGRRAPVSSVAGFVTFETVSPLTPGSVSVTSSSTDAGSCDARPARRRRSASARELDGCRNCSVVLDRRARQRGAARSVSSSMKTTSSPAS